MERWIGTHGLTPRRLRIELDRRQPEPPRNIVARFLWKTGRGLTLIPRRRERRRITIGEDLLQVFQDNLIIALDTAREVLDNARAQKMNLRKELATLQRAASTDIDLAPDSLRITNDELEFMKLLALAISTPRAAKRLANVYRLIRAHQQEWDRFLDVAASEGGYQAVLFSLGILVGFPQQAALVFQDILVRSEGNDSSYTWDAALPDWQIRETNSRFSNKLVADMNEFEAEEWRKMLDCIETIRSQQRSELGERLPSARWLRLVSRFSFRTGPLAEFAEELEVIRTEAAVEHRRSIHEYTDEE